MTGTTWVTGSFLDNFDKAVIKLGYSQIPLAYGLARVPWRSIEQRDNFLDALTRLPVTMEPQQ